MVVGMGRFYMKGHKWCPSTGKFMYTNKSAANRVADNMGEIAGKYSNVYKCKDCESFHIGHTVEMVKPTLCTTEMMALATTLTYLEDWLDD